MAQKGQCVMNQTEVKSYFQNLLTGKVNKVHPDTSKSYSHLFSNDKSADTLNVEDPSTIRINKERDPSSPQNTDKYGVFPESLKKTSTLILRSSQEAINHDFQDQTSQKSRMSLVGQIKLVGKMAKSVISGEGSKSHSRKSLFNNDEYQRNLATAMKFLDVSSNESPFLKFVKQFIFFNIQIFIFFMNLLSVINVVLISNYRLGAIGESWKNFLTVTEWIIGFNFGFEVLLTLMSSKTLEQLLIQFFSFEVISNLLLISDILTTTLCSDDFEKVNQFFVIINILRSLKLIKLRMIITFTTKEFRKIMKNDQIQLDAKNEQSELKYFVYSNALDIVIGIFIEASIYLAADELCNYEGYFASNGPTNFTYIGAAYFAIVSITTIGYGDIVPNYKFSRALNVVIMLFNISVLSNFISKMAEKMYELSPYIRNFSYKNHIVVIGDLPVSFTKYFLKELYQCDFLTSQVYNEDGSRRAKVSKIILIGKEDPQRDLETWLEDFSLKNTEIKYLKSHVLESLWHKQANLSYARHLFAFSMNPNENQAQGMESDKQMAYNIQRVVNQFPKLDITLVLSTEFSNQIKNDSLWSKVTVISAQILNEYIMANSLENQGLNIWLTHLATLREKNEFLNNSNAELNHLEEYGQNMSQEIYPIKLPQYFVGKTFQEVMKIIYFSVIDLSDSFSFDYTEINRKTLPNRAGILLLGIEHYEKDDIVSSNESKFLINPIDYKIQKGDIGFVIAYDQENAKIMTNFTEKSNLYSTYMKNMNLFKKLKIAASSNKYIDKMRVNMNERLSDWKIKKQKYFNKTNLTNIRDFDSNLYEIPAVYNLYNNVTPKGIFKNHIIIRGDLFRLKRIASVLRSYSERPILLYADQDPNPSEWHKIRDTFKNIYYVLGSPTNINHLMQIDPKKAFKILILSSSDNNFIMDSESIVFTRIISDFFESRNFLTELMDENNLRYISINPKYEVKNFFFWPYFLRGSVHFSSLAMSIIAKSINNKSWFSFIRNVTKPNHLNNTYENGGIQQNSKINTLIITAEIKKELQFFGQMQYVLMSHDPPVIGIAVLKEKFTSQPTKQGILRQLSYSTIKEKEKNLNKGRKTKEFSKQSFQMFTNHILKVMDNYYGSEFLMTNPSFLMPLDVGDKVLVIGSTRLEDSHEYFGKMINSSFKLPTPRGGDKDKDMSKSRNKEDFFDFSLNGLNANADMSAQRQQMKKRGAFKDKMNENLENINELMKYVMSNWDDLNKQQN